MTLTLRSRRAKHAGRIYEKCARDFFLEKIVMLQIPYVPPVRIFFFESREYRVENIGYTWLYIESFRQPVQLFS